MKIFKKSVIVTSLSVLSLVGLGTFAFVGNRTNSASKTNQPKTVQPASAYNASSSTSAKVAEKSADIKAPTTAPVDQPAASAPAAVKPAETPAPAPAPKPQPGIYTAYSDQAVKQAGGGKTVLFFAASWCHTCRDLDQNIGGQLSNIPAGVTIIKVDYDSATALKQKYGVTYQHTLVQVNADGSAVHKWAGSPTLQDVINEI